MCHRFDGQFKKQQDAIIFLCFYVMTPFPIFDLLESWFVVELQSWEFDCLKGLVGLIVLCQSKKGHMPLEQEKWSCWLIKVVVSLTFDAFLVLMTPLNKSQFAFNLLNKKASKYVFTSHFSVGHTRIGECLNRFAVQHWDDDLLKPDWFYWHVCSGWIPSSQKNVQGSICASGKHGSRSEAHAAEGAAVPE